LERPYNSRATYLYSKVIIYKPIFVCVFSSEVFEKADCGEENFPNSGHKTTKIFPLS
jgi:hypothetical protein